MTILQAATPLSRRRALKLGAGLTGGLFAATSIGTRFADAQEKSDAATTSSKTFSYMPPVEIQNTLTSMLNAEGVAQNNVYAIPIVRDDIRDVTLHGIPIQPSFQLSGELDFQMVPPGSGQPDYHVAVNGGVVLKEDEVQKFIFALLEGSLWFQSLHQRFFDSTPVWVVNFRGSANVNGLASVIKSALDTTATPFPQVMPGNPKTSLHSEQLGAVLGATPRVTTGGVVAFTIPRIEHYTLGGMTIGGYFGIASKVAFQTHGGGQNAAVATSIAMLAAEVNNVNGYMMKNGWEAGALYNQETDESPQLYFGDFFKTGDSVTLAKEVRQALQLTLVNFN